MPQNALGTPHILFLIDQLLELGGAERVLFEIIERMPKEKFRCSLATFRGYAADLQVRVKCPVHVFPLVRTYDLRALSVARRLRCLIRSQHIDIVHTFFETSDLWGGAIAKLSGCPSLISSRRDLGIGRSRKHKVAYPALRHLFDRVVTVSDSVRDYCIREDRMDPRKVITLYNGIDLENVDRVRDLSVVPQSLRAKFPLVTTVANIRRIKGLEVFLRAAAITRLTCPQTKFLVIGEILDQNCFQELRAIAHSLDLDRSLTFLGPVDDVIPYLKVSTAFCLFSHSEGFSNALIEAMACGLPSVATRVGGNVEAIADGECGFLVAPNDANTAATRIVELIANRGRAAVMGTVARRRVEDQFTFQAMIEKLTSVYESLMACRRNMTYSPLAHTRLANE